MNTCPPWMVIANSQQDEKLCEVKDQDGIQPTKWYIRKGATSIDYDQCQNECQGVVKIENDSVVCHTSSPCDSNGLSMTWIIVLLTIFVAVLIIVFLLTIYRTFIQE